MLASRIKLRRNSEFSLPIFLLLLTPGVAADELKPTDETLKALLTAALQARNAYDWQKKDNDLPKPAAVLIPAFLQYADLRKSGTDAIIALDWVSEHANEADRDPEQAATLITEATRRLEKMDLSNKTVKESIAFAEYTRGYLLYLSQTPIGFRSHDAAQSIVTDEKRIAAALEAFKRAAAADPKGESGMRAAEFIPEIEHQRPGTKAPDLLGVTADDKPVRLSDYKGKVVVVKFWATYYGTLGDQFESERSVRRELKSPNVVVLLAEIVGAGTIVRVRELTVADAKIEGTAEEPSKDGKKGTGWSIRGMPQTYVIDSDGVVRFASFSERSEKLLDTVKALVK